MHTAGKDVLVACAVKIAHRPALNIHNTCTTSTEII